MRESVTQFFIFAVAILAAWPVRAQDSGNFQDQVKAHTADIEKQRKSGPVSSTSTAAALAEAATTGATSDFSDSFVLAAVQIDGATALTPAELASIYEPMLAQPATRETLQLLTSQLTLAYRKQGYALAHAEIPPQTPQNGILRLRMVEGRIRAASVLVDGKADAAQSAAFFAAVGNRPIQQAVLERALLRFEDMEGIVLKDVRLRRVPGESGQYEAFVDLKRQRVRQLLYADNRGSEGSGPVQMFAQTAIRSVLQTGDEVRLSVFGVPNRPSELLYFNGVMLTPIGTSGLQAELSASRSKSKPEFGSSSDIVKGTSSGAEASVSYPLKRSRSGSIWLRSEFSARNISQTINGTSVVRDKVRAVRLAISGIFAEGPSTRLEGRIEFSKGLNIFGAAALKGQKSRIDGRTGFAKIYIDAAYTAALSDQFSIKLAAAGQYAPHGLLSSEEFSLGGARFGRAFNYNQRMGDSGAAASAKLRFSSEDKLLGVVGYQLYGFGDVGSVFNYDTSGTSSLASTGIGVRLFLDEWLELDLEGAIPVLGDINKPRLWVSVTSAF